MHEEWLNHLPADLEPAEAVVLTDWKGKIAWANLGFLKMTGFSLEELVGHKPGTLLQGQATNSKVVDAMHDAISLGAGVGVIVRNYTKFGTPYDVSLAISPLLDANGAIQSFVAVSREVTGMLGAAVQATRARVLQRLSELLLLHLQKSGTEGSAQEYKGARSV